MDYEKQTLQAKRIEINQKAEKMIQDFFEAFPPYLRPLVKFLFFVNGKIRRW